MSLETSDVSLETHTRQATQTRFQVRRFSCMECTISLQTSLLAVFTVSLGYLVREPGGSFDFISLTVDRFSCGGAAALNQWMEREEDAWLKNRIRYPCRTNKS